MNIEKENMKLLVLLLLLLHATDAQQISTMRSDYDINGVRLATNNHIAVTVQNDYNTYSVVFYPFGPDNYCYPSFASSQNFVASVAIGRKQTANQTFFVYLQMTEDEPGLLE